MAKLHQQKCIMHDVVFITETCMYLYAVCKMVVMTLSLRWERGEARAGATASVCALQNSAAAADVATELENPKECRFTIMFCTIWDREAKTSSSIETMNRTESSVSLRWYAYHIVYIRYMHCAFIRLMHSLTQTSALTLRSVFLSLVCKHACTRLQHLCTCWNDAISFSSTIRVFWHMDAVCECVHRTLAHCTRNT